MQDTYVYPGLGERATTAAPVIVLSLLCFLASLQFCAYYARFYATRQSIMLVVICRLIQKSS